jgi:acetolactate synthase I/II/III large subunit
VADSNSNDHPDTGALGRRDFFKGAAAGAAGLIVTGHPTEAAAAPPAPAPPAVVVPTDAHDLAYAQAQSAVSTPAVRTVPTGQQPASDFMVDVLKKLDFDYVAINPGSAFAGLHESLINYSGNRTPEILTALHEEAAIAMAHGYAKAAGKPMLVCVHGTVGMLHGSMALFQAWADRVPVVLIVGQHRNPTGVINLPHSAQDMGSIVRDFVKFDDETTTLERFAESTLRAYQIATTPPMGPVLLSVDAELQEELIDAKDRPRIPELVRPSPPQGDTNAVREAARLLVNAETPLLLPRKLARTPRGWDLMIELGETLQAPVDVGTYGSWQDFPSWHPLWGNGGTGYRADVTLGLEMSDMSALARAARASGRKTISISSEHLFQHSNIHDYGRYADVDLAIAGDAEATLPSLIEEVKKLVTADRRRALADRGGTIAAAHKEAHKKYVENASFGWGNSPISVPRMIAELGEQVKNDDWAIVSGHQFTGDWQRRLMNFDKHYRYNGDNGGFGIGYDTPGSVGAALAHKRQGRLSIGIVGDGDLNFQPGVLWTAVHHKIPLLLVVHNNRAYHAEVMIVQRMCGSRGRGMANASIGSVINDPPISYSGMAKAYGMYAEGPIDNPRDLAAAYQRALAKVRAGEPALIDVIAQPR